MKAAATPAPTNSRFHRVEKARKRRQAGRAQLERQRSGRPDGVHVTIKGGDFPSREDEKVVVIGLKDPQLGEA
jgi:hypothetical protein